ncbi:MAG: cation transporter [Erysipelotrichaceae bacterium]|nr:cation transporter [Erysipelotrichaceae bacterium]
MSELASIQEERSRTIVKVSMVGIITNILLASFKAIIGLLSHSIAVVLDAVNNLSDALSSVITIIGARLGNKRADKAHPLGHGRYEYLSAMVVSALVLYAGITSLGESVKKIITPEEVDYSAVSLIIIAVAVLVKILLGTYVKKKGEEVNSPSLVDSGSDARFDAIISFSVLLSAIIFLTTGLSLEAYLGVAISIFIVKSGIDMFKETINEILGARVDREFTAAIKDTILEEEQVQGVYDLILHNYGPDRYVGSVHVAVDESLSASEIDKLERDIAHKVFMKHGIALTGIGIYSVNSKDETVVKMRDMISRIVMSHDNILQIHGFYVDKETKTINLDIIIDYDLKEREELFKHITEEVQGAFPDYTMNFTMDIDI